MNNDQARQFADSASYEDCAVEYNGAFFWCYGRTWDEKKGVFGIAVDKYKTLYPAWEFEKEVLRVESPNRDECMKHFLEDPIFDGKSFWEAAPEMKWW